MGVKTKISKRDEKTSDVELTGLSDIEEDLKQVKQQCNELKAENVELREKVKGIDQIQRQNEQLQKQ